jgi:hypothetical protein
VLLGEHAKRIQTAWLLPLSQVPAVAAVRTKKYVMRANRNPASADKYSQFRCDNSNEIVDRLSRMFHTLQ